MRSGAADFLQKAQITPLLLERVIRYSMDRKISKDRLQASERQLSHLSSKLLEVQENERRKIASELHDHLGQLLTAIKYTVENVLNQMNPAGPGANELQNVVPMIQVAVEHVREIYTDLRPYVLDDLGINATLSWYCRRLESEYPTLRILRDFGSSEPEISEGLKLIVFRIVQESMDNIVTHSGADTAILRLSSERAKLRLDIEDNGKGFDVNQITSTTGTRKGIGLISAKRRVELSGGTFELESNPGQGTRIRISWPL